MVDLGTGRFDFHSARHLAPGASDRERGRADCDLLFVGGSLDRDCAVGALRVTWFESDVLLKTAPEFEQIRISSNEDGDSTDTEAIFFGDKKK